MRERNWRLGGKTLGRCLRWGERTSSHSSLVITRKHILLNFESNFIIWKSLHAESLIRRNGIKIHRTIEPRRHITSHQQKPTRRIRSLKIAHTLRRTPLHTTTHCPTIRTRTSKHANHRISHRSHRAIGASGCG